MLNTEINYLIALENDGEFSPFQGYSTSLLKRRNLIRRILTTCPPNLFELFNPSDMSLLFRITGQCRCSIVPMMAREIGLLELEPPHFFWVVFVNSKTRDEVRAWAGMQIIEPLVFDVSTDGKTLPRERIVESVLKIIEQIEQQFPKFNSPIYSKLKTIEFKKFEFDVPIPKTNHNTCLPNEIALMSCGGVFSEQIAPLNGENEVYVKRIYDSSRAVVKARRILQECQAEANLTFPPSPSLVITSPSSYRHIYQHNESKAKSKAERLSQRFRRLLAQQNTYATVFGEKNAMEMIELLKHDVCKKMMSIRMEELDAFTDSISILSASYLAPTVRMLPESNQVRLAMRRLVDHIRAYNHKKARKLPKLSQSFFNMITSLVPSQLREAIEVNHTSIKIVSDTPFELADSKGIPLMLRNTVSRIPATPGNVSFSLALPHEPIQLLPSSVGETVVVRSFKDGDPLSSHLETAVSSYKMDGDKKMPVRFIDVADRAGLVAAINQSKGLALVLDCHGTHTQGGHAVLNLRDEDVDTWSLRSDCNMPPIVVCCACDTHALDRNHVTVSTGLLDCGARTAISTSLPVHFREASIFTARFLYRLYKYVPAINSFGRPQRFDSIFGQMQKMNFVSELLRRFEKHFKTEGKSELQIRTTGVIHTTGFDWYEIFLEDAANEFGSSTRELEDIRKRKLAFPESYKYMMLGNPETIVFRPATDLESPALTDKQ